VKIRSALFALGLSLMTAPAAAAEPPRVVASILPLHSLVSAVMEGVGTPHLLLPGHTSPHDYTMKPSDARVLDSADVVFWIGESLETMLERPIDALAADAVVVAAAEAKGVVVLPVREGGAWEAHGHDDHDDHDKHEKHDDEHKHEEEHAHHGGDPHLWLSPANAKALLSVIAGTLSKADPEHAATYRANATKAQAAIDAAAQAVAATLAPVRERPYIVFHDAYQYFERHFRTNAVGSVTLSDARRPSAARVREIQHKIADAGAVCVFSEPQFEPKLVRTLTAGTNARAGELDPLGAVITPGAGHYLALLSALADSLADCLK